ncbi:MAG: DUF418 domain-containing protein [Sphingomicrobium sp.]
MTNSMVPGERIFSLDVIRGIAVMGIFSVNVVAFAMIEQAYFNPAAYGGTQGADRLVWALNLLLIDGKMRSLFSMLFGASMLLVIERAEAAGQSGIAVHIRRMLILLGIGLAHYFLLWFGDILTLYAITGLVAVWFRNWRPRKLMVGGVIATLVGLMIFAAWIVEQHGAQLAAHAPHASLAAIDHWNDGMGSFVPTRQAIADDLAIHRGGWWTLVDHKLGNTGELLTATMVFLPETLGLMLFGMAGYKSGFLTGQWPLPAYRRFALITVSGGFAAFALLVWADLSSNFDIITLFGGFVVGVTPFRIAMAAGYAALIVLATRHHGWLVQRIAATGRAAFTNYLGTSLIAAFVFYGWGFGLYGSVSRAQAWLLVPIVWAIMLLWSKPWLDRYRYGPLEWLWRSLSRGRLQPMRR